MGEVYRARDTSLGRDVAIKVLPEAFARDPDRLARFEREAQLLASLNHPNIAHDLRHSSRRRRHSRALVLELIEGADARRPSARAGAMPRRRGASRSRGRLPTRSTPRTNAASSIATSSRRTSRSRPDGTVKVLDFGLAKATRRRRLTPRCIATLDGTDGTRGGMMLGTPGYMSPEQARGQAVDKRTDIWAFGCVLFEMLTGRTPFDGDTLSDTIAAMLDHDPDWSALPADAPEPIRRVLRRCLERDLRRRLRDIGDVCADLDEPIAPRPDSSGTAATKSVSFQRLTDLVGVNQSPALSPDGRMVAFVAPMDGRRQIWIRMLSGGAPLRVTHDESDHESPRWTADGSSILYYVGPDATGELGHLWEVSALGGQPRPLVSSSGGCDSSRDGRRLVTFQPSGDRVEFVAMSRDDGRIEHLAYRSARVRVRIASRVS